MTNAPSDKKPEKPAVPPAAKPSDQGKTPPPTDLTKKGAIKPS